MMIAPIIIFVLGISLKNIYPRMIPKTITEYRLGDVTDKGAYIMVNTENRYARVRKILEVAIRNIFSQLIYIGKNTDAIPKAIVTSKEVMKIISKLLEESLKPLVTTSLNVRNIAAEIGKIKI